MLVQEQINRRMGNRGRIDRGASKGMVLRHGLRLQPCPSHASLDGKDSRLWLPK